MSCEDSISTEEAPESLFTALEVVIVLVWIVGLPGNALSIAAVFKYKKLRTAGNIFVTNLSISDGLYYSISLPVRFYTFYIGEWAFTDDFCSFFGGISHFLNGASVLFLSAIALNRLLFIQHSKNYSLFYSRKGQALQISVIWLFSLTMTIILPVTGVWGGYNYQQTVRSCTVRPCQDSVFKFTIVFIGFCIPAGFIIVCYGLIFKHYKASQRRVSNWGRKLSTKPGLDTNTNSDSVNISANQNGTVEEFIKPKIYNTGMDAVACKEVTSKTEPIVEEVSPDIGDDSVFEIPLPVDDTIPITRSKVDFQNLCVTVHSDRWTMRVRSMCDITTEIDLSADKENIVIGTPGPSALAPTVTTNKQKRVSFSEAIHCHQKPILVTNRSKTPSTCSHGSKASTKSNSKKVQFGLSAKQQKEAIIMTIMMICIFVLFTICLLPYFVVNMVHPNLEDPVGYLVSLMFTWFNGCINPAIYALMNIQYRNAYKALLFQSGCLKKCKYLSCRCHCKSVKPVAEHVDAQLQQSATHI